VKQTLRRFCVFLLGLTAVALCCSCTREINIPDVSRNDVLHLQKRASQEHIHGISIAAEGSVLGRGEVQLLRDGEIYQRKTVEGPVRFEWRCDWYSDQAEIRYVAGTVTSGTLTLRYDFKD
jgi:hypothetical protein